MKKLILVISAFVISIGAYAQTDSLNKKMSPTDSRTQDGRTEKSYNSGEQTQDPNRTSQTPGSHPDGYMMENGRMVQYRGGKATPLETTGTLSNGTKIMSDGTYTTSDGRKMTLKNGEHLGMDGKLVPMSSTPKSGGSTKTTPEQNMGKGSMPDTTNKKSNSPR